MTPKKSSTHASCERENHHILNFTEYLRNDLRGKFKFRLIFSKELHEFLLTKFSVVTFIQKDFSTNFLHHNIPRINGSITTHKSSQYGVGGKNIGIGMTFGEFSDNRIVCSSYRMNNSINFSQGFFILNVDL